jgi:aspartate/methionine/tyrosine aminotransferase
VNPRIAEIAGSQIRRIAALKRATSKDLGLGEPSLSPNQAHLDAAMRHVAKHGMRYTPNAGDPALRKAIAEHYAYPGMVGQESVCVTVGSQEAMYVTLKTLLDPAKDELLVVEPAFPSYIKMAALERVEVRSISMREDEDFAFDAERILSGVGPRTRAIVLCSPCNPTGRVLTRDQGEALVDGLQRRGGEPIWLIHDEIYREQVFVDDAVEFARLYPHTVSTNSLSKSNALTGLRLGWLVAPPTFVEQAIKCHAWVTSCADTFAQAVALNIFTTRGALSEHAAWYAERRNEVAAAIQAFGFRALPIDGSFYACVRLPEGVSSLDAALDLIERDDVVAIPGGAFGASFDQWLRLSWVAPLEDVREGLKRIDRYCSDAVSAGKAASV